MATNLGDAVVNIDVNVTGMANLNALGTQLRGLSGLVGRVKTAFAQGGAQLAQFGIDVRRVSFALRDAGRQFTLFGAALIGSLAAITVEGAKFEQGLSNTVSVISELQDKGAATTATIQELSDFFLRLAGDTVFTAEQITDAASQLALAGFSVREIQDSLRGIADLAAAAGEDAATTAKAAAVILRSFQLEASDINRVADTLTAAFTNSLNTLESLREAFKLVAPTASAFGLQLEDVATALGILGNTGLSGSIAGTGLSRLITQLASDVDKVNELLESVGSSQANVDPLKNSIRDIVAEFEGLIVSGKLTEAQLAGTFDQRAVRALLNLVGQGAIAFDDLNEKIENSAGLTKEIAETKLDTVIGQFTLLKSEISILVTEIFNVFKDDLKEMIINIKGMVKATSEWVRENKELVKFLVITTAIVGGLSIAFGALLLVLGSLAAAIAAIIILFSFVSPPILVLAAVIAGTLLVFYTLVGVVVYLTFKLNAAIVAIGQFLGLIRTDEEYAESLKQYGDALDVLSSKFDTAIDRASKFASQSEKAIAILKKAGTASEGEIKVVSEIFSELGISSSDDLKVEGNRIYDEYVAIIDQVNDLIESANRGEIELDTVQIKSLQDQANFLLAQAKDLADQAEDFGAIEDILFKTDPAKFKQTLADYEKDIESTQKRIQQLRRKDSLTDSEGAELQRLEGQLDKFKTARNLLASFSQETFEIFSKAARDSSILTDGLEAVADYEKVQAAARKAAEEFRKSAEEANDTFQESLDRIREGAETSLEAKIRQLNELSDQIEASYSILTQAVPFGPVNTILTNARLEALDEVQKQKDALFADQAANRTDTVRELALERAKLDKDVKEAQRLLQEDRDADREAKLKKDFEVPDSADPAQIAQNNKDRLDFIKEYNLQTERLLDNLEEELTKQDEVKDKTEKITRKESERNELEKSITKQLSNQVKSISDAQAVLRFARGEQERRFREAREGARDQARAEERLFDSIKKRAALEAQGKDTTDIDRRIRLQEKLRQVETDRRNVLDGQTGVTQQREDTFKQDLEKIQSEAKAIGDEIRQNNIQVFNDVVKGVSDVLAAAPAAWVDVLIQGWSAEIPRFIQSILGLGIPNFNGALNMPSTIPGLSSPNVNPSQVATSPTYNDNKVVTFNINEATDADAVAKVVQDKLFRTPPRFTV